MAGNSWGNLTSRAVCLALGAWMAVTLSDSLRPAVQWKPENKPRPIRVSVRAAPPAVVAKPQTVVAPREVLPLKADVAPPKQPKPPKPRPIPKVEVAATAPVEIVAPIPQIVSEQPLPTLSQPDIAPPVPRDIPVLPPIAGAETPPVPPENAEINKYPEQPGGSVLVLELIVNDQGVVIDSRILVPSKHGLADFTLVMAIKGQKWKDLTPPLYPGEKRRLEIRVPFQDDKPDGPAEILP